MSATLTPLLAAMLAFVGSHFALSHPFRGMLARVLGEAGFAAVYSLVAFATLGWVVVAFRAAPAGGALWDGGAALPWAAASALTLIAAVLLAGSFVGNPALPAPGAEALAQRPPHGVFRTTRHPMMWGFALWSTGHALVAPTPRVMVLTGGIALLALVGAHLQDRKKAALMGAAWQGWTARTHYWPRLAALPGAGLVPWGAGTALWLAATWAHIPLILMPAGVWRWLIG